jgi:hypothetical protein
MFFVLCTIALFVLFIGYCLAFIVPLGTMPHYETFQPPKQFSYAFQRDAQAISDAVPADDDVAFLQMCLYVMEERYVQFEFLQMFVWVLYQRDINTIWDNRYSFQPCNVLSFVLGCLCVASGRFRPQDIRVEHTYSELSVHQYLVIHRVRPHDVSLAADPWGYITEKIPLGKVITGVRELQGSKHASAFHNPAFEQCVMRTGTPRACIF